MNYLEERRIMKENQSGFRAKRRTADILFILKTAINKYLSHRHQKLFLCYFDFSKAFDRVWRDGLLKLIRYGIGGKIFNSVKSKYADTLAALKVNQTVTSCFKSELGVKQGDNLSPTLFNVYLNDIIVPREKCNPVKLSVYGLMISF